MKLCWSNWLFKCLFNSTGSSSTLEFPYGHSHPSHSHHLHHRRDEEGEDNYPPPSNLSSFDNPPPQRPQSFYGVDEPPPPPFPASSHVYHSSHESHNYSDYPPPPPQTDPYNYNYPSEVPPPRPVYSPANTTASVHHVSHEVDQSETYHGYRPHLPSFSHHKNDDISSHFFNKPTFKVYCQANPNYSLTIRDGEVILAPSNPSDEFQHWYKDEKYSTRVKDEQGFPCFALVNKATGQAIKHATGASHPVRSSFLFFFLKFKLL
ncbi:hypothetical protein L6164_000924 [Bauhinia variegata]|uniref:Uncharacterized protein n=1 Tax=Bauhinia variegata TaxID=167791 RepID=A0ACB9QE53_BAUVA|nr:hypothetical protein L6164_000924 [Bauhinia variegata]